MKVSFKAILGTVLVVIGCISVPVNIYEEKISGQSSYQYSLKSDGIFRTNSMSVKKITDYDHVPTYLNRAVIEDAIDEGCGLYEVTMNIANIGNCDIEYTVEDFHLGDTFDANGENVYGSSSYNYKLYYDNDGRSYYVSSKFGRNIIPVGGSQDVKSYFLLEDDVKQITVEVYSIKDESLDEGYRTMVGTVDIPSDN